MNYLKKLILAITVIVVVGVVLGLSLGIIYSQDKLENSKKAKNILYNYPLIDGHNDIPIMIRRNFKNQFEKFNFTDIKKYISASAISHTDLDRIKSGGLGGQFWVSYAPCSSNNKDAARIHLEQVDVIKRLVKKYSNQMKLVTNSNDLKSAFREKKIASLIGLESGHAIDSSLALLRTFFNLGVRYMTLTHNCDVPWATNNLIDRQENASAYGGLNDFGRKVIREMNRLGMMVDLSHVSYKTMNDALDESKAPVIFSHSSVHALCDHPRNVRDDVLQKLKKNNGIIMINFFNGFVNCVAGTETNVDSVVEHFVYVKNLIGVDHIGIGADYDGVTSTPIGLEDVSKYPNLLEKLLDKGWSESDIIKVIGGNLIRVLNDVEQHANSMKSMLPIDDIIHNLSDDFKRCRTLK